MTHNFLQLPDGSTVFRDAKSQYDTLKLSRFGVNPNYALKNAIFDDFFGDTLDAAYSGAAGSDSPAAIAINMAKGGTVRLTTGDSNASVAADAVSLTHGLNWYAGNGNLMMEIRLKVDVITAVKINVGFTDTLATTTLEEPFTISTTSLTSNTTDGACFIFDTAATNVKWQFAGVKADTDTAITNTAIAPTAATYQTLRIEIDSSGTAEFFIDGMSYGSVANAVTTTVALTPVITARATNTTSKNVDIDYLRVTQDRV